MQVYFQRMAFIDGNRYRKGLQNYVGDLKFLPSDAVVDGKKVKDLKAAELSRAQKAASKENVKEAREAEKEAEDRRLDIVDGSGNKIGEVNETVVEAELLAQQREPTPPPEPTPEPTPEAKPATESLEPMPKDEARVKESDVKPVDAEASKAKVTETEPKASKPTTTAKSSDLDPFSGPASKK